MNPDAGQSICEMVLTTINNERAFLMNIIKDFDEEEATFQPTPEMFSVAQQIRHIGFVVGWFREAAFGSGFDMDFEALHAQNTTEVNIEDALIILNREYDASIHALSQANDQVLSETMADNEIIGPVPRYYCFLYQADHTAHHRGALMVYLRLLGRTPRMVYG